MNNVPFLDLKAQYLSIKNEIDAAIHSVIADAAFIGGKYVENFSREFREVYGVRNCVPVANGTDAIYIVLKMLGIGAGDEVITVANSWISTSETISQTGAIPVFVDADEYFTIDVSKIESKITSRTKAIIPVHLYGQMADLVPIIDICKRYNLYLIEDCAQSHFSEIDGKRAGTLGLAGTFSFFPGKNLGAYGDAGAIITNDDELASKCRMFANHGALVKHQHQIEGINSRLDGLQAAILSVKLKYIIKWTEQRIKCAANYDALLHDIPNIKIPRVRPASKHSFHLYVIKARNREKLIRYLSERKIETSIHYPTPLPLLPAYKYLNHHHEDFPIAVENQGLILSLPMFPELSYDQQVYVAEAIKSFYKRSE